MNKKVSFLFDLLFTLFTLLLFNHSLIGQIPENNLLLDGKDDYIQVPNAPSLNFKNQISVECWIKPQSNNWSNKPQYLLSKTSYKDLDHIKNFDNWPIYNATNQSGANDVNGFVGAIFDGRYVYFSPWLKSNFPEQHSGQILRYDTHGGYMDEKSWDVYDAHNEDGLGDIRGLEGAVFDGTYIYFVPLHHENIYFGKILRYDTRKNFKDPDSWDVYNAENEDGKNLTKGFVGAIYDGQYVYFVPNSFSPHGQVLRFNTKSDFFDTSAWDVFNVQTLAGSAGVTGFFGAVFDGRFAYFIPLYSEGKFLRLDTKKDFSDPASWDIYDARQLFVNAPVVPSLNFTGGAFDGRYMYFSQYYGGKILRYDTQNNFLDNQSWQIHEVVRLGSSGGIGPVYNGRYVYFPPMVGADYGTSGKIVSYDTHQDFSENTAWDVVDIFDKDNQFLGFEGAVFDGNNVYMSPMNFGDPHGKILKHSYLDLSYALVYNQTSSSFGSVMQRPTFKIGTTAGLRTVSLANDYNLADGEWHHLAATYDGKQVKIYIDGKLDNTATYSTNADLIINDSDLTIGGEAGGKNCFGGSVSLISLYDIALSEETIKENNQTGKPAASLVKTHFPMDEGIGVTTSDNIEPKNVGSLVNNPLWSPLIKPTLIIPFDSVYCQPDTSENVILTWQKVKASENYQAQIAEDELFSKIVYNTPLLSDTTLNISSLQVGKKYYWRVKAFNPSNESPWSTTAPFNLLQIVSEIAIESRTGVNFCEGDSIELTAVYPIEDVTFVWHVNEQSIENSLGKSLIVKQSGQYTVTALYPSGCAVVSRPINISTIPLPSVPEIIFTDVDTLSSSLTGNDYIWKVNGQILNTNTKKIRAEKEGLYSVSVKGDNSCYSHFSSEYQFIKISSADQVTVYPNPTGGQFTIVFENLKGSAELTVTNTIGKTIFTEQLLINDNYSGKKFNIENFNKGVYLLTIKAGNKIVNKKIIMQ